MTACKWHGPYAGEVTGCCIHQAQRDGADAFTKLYATLWGCMDCDSKATHQLDDLTFCDEHVGMYDTATELPWAHIVREQEGR